jgi:uncharacterized protein YkwD
MRYFDLTATRSFFWKRHYSPIIAFGIAAILAEPWPGLTATPQPTKQSHPTTSLQAQGGGVGRYCSVVYPNGGWQLFWHTSQDPCGLATCLQSDCQLGSAGNYFLEQQNQVTVRCQGSSNTFVGWGDRPLSEAFNSVAKPFQPACTFQVNNAPVSGRNPSAPQDQDSSDSTTLDTPVASNTGNSDSGNSDSDIAQEIVDAHNRWRSRVGVAPLQWSPQLANYAQEWANHLASTGQFDHRTSGQYGENLFWGSGRRFSATEVVNDWGNEVKDYDYANNSCRGICGHYTQIVWKQTTEVGCGVARSGNEEVWVCNYNPRGNRRGQSPY